MVVIFLLLSTWTRRSNKVILFNFYLFVLFLSFTKHEPFFFIWVQWLNGWCKLNLDYETEVNVSCKYKLNYLLSRLCIFIYVWFTLDTLTFSEVYFIWWFTLYIYEYIYASNAYSLSIFLKKSLQRFHVSASDST